MKWKVTTIKLQVYYLLDPTDQSFPKNQKKSERDGLVWIKVLELKCAINLIIMIVKK